MEVAMKYMSLVVGALLLATGALAQTAQPYAGLQNRPIKALSEQQVADLRAGRGVGLALAAELNGYPGPLHVLELGDRLKLSAAQREHVQKLFASMKSEAVPLGEALIEREAQLDQLFASRTVTPHNLVATTQAIGDAQASLRATHLKYHLSTLELLSADQVRQYSALRGYGDGQPAQHQHRQH
jgi:hypothetical protein